MSMRWIHETQTPPNCTEESSDIDDSCSEESYDSDLSLDSDFKDESHHRAYRRINKQYAPCFIIGDQRKNEKFNRNLNMTDPYVIWDPRPQALNPIYHNSKIKLHCRTGYHLSVDEYGKVRGIHRLTKYPDVFVIVPVAFGIVRIQNTETNLYIAFSAKGRLYGESNPTKDNTEWEQWQIGSFDAFRSRKYAELNWWIGIKNNSRPKLGPATSWGQKAIQFSPLIKGIIKNI